MNYRHGFVLKEANDYLRKVDMSYMSFIEKQEKDLRIRFDDSGRIYIEEDVNAARTAKLVQLLEDNGYDIGIVSYVKWKKFPDKPELFE